MNKTLRMLILVTVAFGASAQESGNCRWTFDMADLAHVMGTGIAIQPVYHRDGVKGWRIYGTDHSAELMAAGIASGALMTHVCGIPAKEIYASKLKVCCDVDVSSEIEVTFKLDDGETRILLKRH